MAIAFHSIQINCAFIHTHTIPLIKEGNGLWSEKRMPLPLSHAQLCYERFYYLLTILYDILQSELYKTF